jgi:rSAM/selenodomain-associated transferase 1
MMDKNSMRDTALIIFVRHPELGKVKTRLAKVIGDDKALTVYKQLLNHTYQITSPLDCRKFVYYAENVMDHDLWSSPGFTKRKQSGGDLGERMRNAFEELFNQGFKKVLIIGSDCYQLQTEILQEAINLTGIKEVVIGPTFDGGYYLLGTDHFVPELFINKIWSTEQVIKQTLEDTKRLSLSHHLLKKLHDVDEAADLEVNQIFI